MQKSFLLTVLILTVYFGGLCGQSFDWNIRGGLNIMNGQPSDKDISLFYHAGVQAGVRIAYFGVYGEAIYSMHENQYGGDPVAYLMPGIVVKRYLKQFLFVDFGGAFLSKIGDSGVPDDTLNPDNELVAMAGLGTAFSNFELSVRAASRTSYGVIQVTAAVKF